MTTTHRVYGPTKLSKLDLMGIRFMTDPAPAAGAGDLPADPPAAAPSASAAPPAAPAAPPAAPAAQPVNYRGDPDEYVRELRQEARTHREAAEAATATAAERERERDAAAAARDELARTNKLILAAPKLGANAEMLLDSSSFMKTFASVDLAKPDDVKKAIEDALERNSAFKAGPALPHASGGGHQGGHNSKSTPTLAGAVSKALGG
jgi:hypothetical protein